MKLKWTLALALVVFFTAGCSGMQEKRPVSEQTQDNQSKKKGGQQEKSADETEKPNAQPGSTTDPQVKPSNQPKTTNQTIKIHDESIEKDAPIINITYPQIEGMKNKNAQAQINDTLKKKANAADESQMTNEDPSKPSSFDSIYKITFQNDHLISFVYDQYFYLSGAAHGMPSRVPILVDLDNGRIVEAKELFNGSPQTQRLISNLVVKQDVFHTLEAMGEFKQISSDDLLQVYLTKDGIMMYFPPYEYASFAEGTLQYHLSFSDIQSVLNDAFFQSHGIMISKSIASTMIYVSEGYHFSIPKEWLDRLTFERADYSDSHKWISEVNVYFKSADKPLLFSFHMYEKQEWTSLNAEAEVKLAEENEIIYSYSVAQIPQNNLQVNDFIKNVVPEVVKTFQVEF
ncbi:DUF3298 and DUF4163 domain-containing protein [Neobacillus drentensis]|uniref:DUF3298 and DUF4163 domain-containing protein n=1 Tax=Neobacillus drentensis TaxID=220684 RepID=UPI001F2D2608|nr:DUF3298 and DUF4163 domain-containing protein [Neobacillus drentensis]ULT56647.1 DUF3298 and DUF4163 domain-containing protein [Neobacillus drentensis]